MLTKTRDISNSDDVIDARDVIARFEELEGDRESAAGAAEPNDAAEAQALKEFDESDEGLEYEVLGSLLRELKGNGGDEQWRGDWYPITLIRDSYFKEYAQEIAEDCDMINSSLAWPYTCIDWEQAAKELQGDYTSIDFDGVTYWVR